MSGLFSSLRSHKKAAPLAPLMRLSLHHPSVNTGGNFITEIEKLKKELEENTLLLEQYQHQQQRLRNREQYYKKAERAKRAHRLITRGAAIESIIPEIKEMGEIDFYNLMSAVLTQPNISQLISDALRQEGK